eukprot:GGOE01044554.1.p1 GENE.GGOE01044554.1~~GGOE01044554.1.p1  ORF type:complete len:188 (-),score=72.10 GGOE01044554.1:251-814(-)
MALALRQRSIVDTVQKTREDWEALREKCSAYASVVVHHRRQMGVLANRMAQGVLAHIPNALVGVQVQLLSEIDSAMTFLLGSLRDMERLVGAFRRAYLDGRALYETNWEKFHDPFVEALLPLGDDFLHFLQAHYQAHARQLAEWDDVFCRFEKAGSLGDVEQLYTKVSEPHHTTNLPPPPVDGLAAP